MLALGAVVEITPAGSPIGNTIYTFLLDYGQYDISGGDVFLAADRKLGMVSGSYSVVGSDAGIGRQRSFDISSGWYQVAGYDTRIYQSSFWIGDPEQIRVTPEVTAMRVLPEPRDMTPSADQGVLVDIEQNTTAEPRPRRT